MGLAINQAGTLCPVGPNVVRIDDVVRPEHLIIQGGAGGADHARRPHWLPVIRAQIPQSRYNKVSEAG
jgi:hypothetical protein